MSVAGNACDTDYVNLRARNILHHLSQIRAKFRLYIGKRKSERVELEGKKTAFFLRLKNVDLAYLLPQGELKEEEFLKYKENLLPTIDRAEKIKDIEKGLYTVSGLVSRVPVESEREDIIEEIVT